MQTFKETSVQTPIIEHLNTAPQNTLLAYDSEAHELLSDPKFQTSWDALYQSCPWATAFQSRGYVTSWYSVFAEQYIPVITYAIDSEGNLTGLLTMAIPSNQRDSSNKKIIGAGEYESEYQVWITLENNHDEFVKSAFKLMLSTFPKCDILFRFIPSKAVLTCLEKDRFWRSRSVIQAFERPLMVASTERTQQVLKLSRQYRVKLKNLKKIKGYGFEKVHDITAFTQILQEIAVDFDFRQGAMFNKNHFRDNPLKTDFYLELFKQKQLHVTVLMSEKKVIASMVAIQGKRWVHLQGINSHSPFHAKYSPGMLHFYLLGELLTKENVEYFDLTPGRDAYKEKWATEHDEVYSLLVTENRPYLIKRDIRKKLHELLIRLGQRPMSVELAVQKRKHLIKNKGWLKGLFGKFNSEIPYGQYTAYEIPKLEHVENHELKSPVYKNSLKDMLDFEPDGASPTRWEFMAKTMLNYGDRKNSFSISDGKRLLACAWHAPTNCTSAPPKISGLPKDANRLEELYCHPDFQEQFEDFILGVINELGKDIPGESLHIITPKKDSQLQSRIAAKFPPQ